MEPLARELTLVINEGCPARLEASRGQEGGPIKGLSDAIRDAVFIDTIFMIDFVLKSSRRSMRRLVSNRVSEEQNGKSAAAPGNRRREVNMAENTFTLKICVVGPCRTGKTLLCRALAEQPIIAGEYSATAAVRIQEFSRTVGVDRVKVQLWDCSGAMQYQSYWSVLGKVGSFSWTDATMGSRPQVQMPVAHGPPRSRALISSGLLQDIDGVLMVMDPSQPEQERDLEQFYMNFAQPNSLTMKQCLVMAIQVTREGSFGLGGWSGE